VSYTSLIGLTLADWKHHKWDEHPLQWNGPRCLHGMFFFRWPDSRQTVYDVPNHLTFTILQYVRCQHAQLQIKASQACLYLLASLWPLLVITGHIIGRWLLKDFVTDNDWNTISFCHENITSLTYNVTVADCEASIVIISNMTEMKIVFQSWSVTKSLRSQRPITWPSDGANNGHKDARRYKHACRL